MDKKTIIIIVASVLLIAIIGFSILGYFYFKNKTSNALEKTQGGAEEITNSATKGVLPSLQTNPLENKPDVNPASNANPIKNIKTNPFE